MFIKDFEIQEKSGLAPQTFEQIFTTHSTAKANLNEMQFFSAVETLSCYYFNVQYDEINGQSFADLPDK